MDSRHWVALTPKEAQSLPIAYFERFNASDVALPKFCPELTAKPSTPKTAARLEPTSERRAEKHVGWCLVLPTLMRSQRARAGRISRSEVACQIFRRNELHCLAFALAIVISSPAVLPQVSYGTGPGAKASGMRCIGKEAITMGSYLMLFHSKIQLQEIGMKSRIQLYVLVTLVGMSGLASAQQGTATQHAPFSEVEENYVTSAEHALVPLVEAMPEDKFSFAPTNGEFHGVRTFADMVKHVAASNYGMAAAILHEKPPVKLDSDADLEGVKGKTEIVKFLQGSFDFLHKALLSINEQNETELIRSPDSDKRLARLEVADRAVAHCWNHYGQLVEYLRTSGNLPPVSHRGN